MAELTREDLIHSFVTQIAKKEGMDSGRATRSWLLDAIAEVVEAIDGKRPTKPIDSVIDGGSY